MFMTREEFLAWPRRAITLLGMSGVGKTTLAYKLPSSSWFHYSGDYRIGTKYLEEPFLDNVKEQAMKVPFLRDLLRSDSIYISSNITVHNLEPISTFLGKIGASRSRWPATCRVPAPATPAPRCRDLRDERRGRLYRQGSRHLWLRPLPE